MKTHSRAARWAGGIVIGAVIAATGILTAAPAQAATNLVSNGDFETGALTPWTAYPSGTSQVVGPDAGDGDAHGGTRFAVVPAGSSISRTITGLTASRAYLAVAYLRNDVAATDFFLGLRYFDAQHPNIIASEERVSASQDWTRIGIAFNTDASHTQLGILLQNASTNGNGYTDDVAVIALSTARLEIQRDQAAAAQLSESGSDPAKWAELQSALAQADNAFWDAAATDIQVQDAAVRLHAAVAAFSPAPVGITSPGHTSYYVSSSTGDDTNDGLTPETAWKTVAKVDASTFAAGDKILFKGGDQWLGTTLHPRGSGAAGDPIVLGAYDDAEAKPLIDSQNDVISMRTYDLLKQDANSHLTPLAEDFYASVYLANQQYWTIQDLEVSNHAPGSTNLAGDGQSRNGIMIMNDNGGTLHSVHVVDCYVHGVLGSRSDKTYWGSAGIIYTVMLNAPDATVQSNYDDVLIQGNYVVNTNRQGIVTNSRQNLRADIDTTGALANSIAEGLSPWYPSTNVVIRNNYVKDVAGDGILPQVTDGALVEYNTVDGFNERSGGASAGIWAWNADHTVFQFNESSGGTTTQDGEGYDLDYGQTGTIYQYNYSHDNDGGFMLICSSGQGSNTSGPGAGVKSQNGVVRYNISQNDQSRTFMFSGYSDGTLIYNNTLYQGAGVNAQPIDFWAWEGTYPTSTSFYNNVFDLQSAGTWNFTDTVTTPTGSTSMDVSDVFTFDGNTIYGAHTAGEPNDPDKLISDPLLVAPGTGTTLTPVGGAYLAPDLDGYRLQAGSPDIGTGVIVEQADGTTTGGIAANGGRDYWGSPVLPGQTPNRGADNSAAAGASVAGRDRESAPSSRRQPPVESR